MYSRNWTNSLFADLVLAELIFQRVPFQIVAVRVAIDLIHYVLYDEACTFGLETAQIHVVICLVDKAEAAIGASPRHVIVVFAVLYLFVEAVVLTEYVPSGEYTESRCYRMLAAGQQLYVLIVHC